ncbi:winged helix DNA-binding domain-containing protein [Cryptosporangium aurantiacum]|uniref:Winged helix DNA-binding domain-containing protein n=1 Tax=Cryptosporangium aurantiacum TaxID=134849 RepID=A0A1M7JMI9_9ACTN|nr:winged helix DNA-binding domain-containing protein [Cryptosporangium aurantiacum]SHM54252.1 Winged helix DNA-binding domain-containing protein [Cryptosporangium aurantiacum]
MTGQRLSRRALNRATLARQFLLERADVRVVDAVERLGGLQAQTPHSWYFGLAARLAGVTPEAVSALLVDRSLVRIALQRSTIHLVSARDGLAWRPLLTPVILRATLQTYRRFLDGVDLDELAAVGRELLAEAPLTFAALEKGLAERWPANDPHALSYTVRALLPLVQVPPRGSWGPSGPVSGPIAHIPAEFWLDAGPVEPAVPDDLVLRYLGAFGPAGVKDAQTWSGLTRLGEVFERLRPRLVTFTDDEGRELFDLPDAPRPGEETPSPVRFLYDFDNLHLSYAERNRFQVPETAEARARTFTKNGQLPGTILVDGDVHGVWVLTRGRGGATLTVRPLSRWSAAQASAIEAEGAALLAFAAPASARQELVVGDPV